MSVFNIGRDTTLGASPASWAGDLIGGLSGIAAAGINSAAIGSANAQNAAMAREFAKMGVQWRVDDARKAGIHPLAALGFNGPQPATMVGDTSWGDAVSNMGQDVSRAVYATRSNDDREMRLMRALELERAGLQNELLRSQISRFKSQTGPGLPVEPVPLRRTVSQPGTPSMEVGSVADFGFADVPGGGKTPIPSKDIKERIEDNWIQETLHALRNNLLPNINPNLHRPKDRLPPGYRWEWSHSRQAYFPTKEVKVAPPKGVAGFW